MVVPPRCNALCKELDSDIGLCSSARAQPPACPIGEGHGNFCENTDYANVNIGSTL